MDTNTAKKPINTLELDNEILAEYTIVGTEVGQNKKPHETQVRTEDNAVDIRMRQVTHAVLRKVFLVIGLAVVNHFVLKDEHGNMGGLWGTDDCGMDDMQVTSEYRKRWKGNNSILCELRH